MPVINICFLCPAPRVPTPELCRWHCRKNCEKKSTEKEQRRKQTTASLNDCFPGKRQVHFSHKCHSPLSRCVYCVCLYIFYLSSLPRRTLPNWYSPNANLRRSILCFIHFSDFVTVNTQVDVFNFEMNVYWRVSERFSLMRSSVSVYCLLNVVTFDFSIWCCFFRVQLN